MLFVEKNVFEEEELADVKLRGWSIIIPNIAVHDDHWVDMTKQRINRSGILYYDLKNPLRDCRILRFVLAFSPSVCFIIFS